MSANRPKLNADETELVWTGSRYDRSLPGVAAAVRPFSLVAIGEHRVMMFNFLV